MSVKITESGEGFEAIEKAMKALAQTKVYVGVPQEKSSRDGDEPTNAELMYIHTNGSPRLRIPARPIIEPAIESAKDTILSCLKDAAMAAAAGDESASMEFMNHAGMAAESAAKDRFGSPELAPNAPITVEGGWMRNRISGKPFFVEGKKSAAPLIDEGSLSASVTYVVEKE